MNFVSSYGAVAKTTIFQIASKCYQFSLKKDRYGLVSWSSTITLFAIGFFSKDRFAKTTRLPKRLKSSVYFNLLPTGLLLFYGHQQYWLMKLVLRVACWVCNFFTFLRLVHPYEHPYFNFSNTHFKDFSNNTSDWQYAGGLNLSHNRLEAVPKEIGTLKNLKKLYLDSNQLKTLPPEIGNLQNLSTLILEHNQIEELPKEIGNCSKLYGLHLNHNQLKTLPPEIGHLQNLSTLELEYNQIEQVPKEIGECPNLYELHLNHNQLKALPPEIGKCQGLVCLYLSHNFLEEIPPEVGNLFELKCFSVWNNRLVILPKEIKNWHNLEFLNLTNNRLTELPPGIGSLENLETFVIAENKLADLPREIGKCQKLVKLDLSRNNLSHLPPEIGELQNLQTLSLKRNQLTTIPECLTRLSRGCTVLLQNNPIPIDVIERFQRTYDGQGPTIITSTQSVNQKKGFDLQTVGIQWLKEYEQLFPNEQINLSWEELLKKTQGQRKRFARFLYRLREMNDYKNETGRKLIVFTIYHLLDLIQKDTPFWNRFSLHLRPATRTCGDRVATVFDWLVDIEYHAHSQKWTDGDLIRFFIGVERKTLIHTEALHFLDNHRQYTDPIQVILYLTITLAKGLEFSAPSSMLLPNLGKINDQDIQNIKDSILKKTSSKDQIVSILLQYDRWKEKLTLECQTEIESINQKSYTQLELIENHKTDKTNQLYLEEVSQCEANRKQAIDTVLKEKTWNKVNQFFSN